MTWGEFKKAVELLDGAISDDAHIDAINGAEAYGTTPQVGYDVRFVVTDPSRTLPTMAVAGVSIRIGS